MDTTHIGMNDGIRENVPDDIIFALDVGTRIIKGVVGRFADGAFRVLAAEVYEHEKRVMFDGQIHDIAEVARCVSAVRDKLEKKTGRRLNAVYIAAAGRVLKTIKAFAVRKLSGDRFINGQTLQSIEIEALLNAREIAEAENAEKNEEFDLVGYSAAGMFLDGYPMTALLGHRGAEVKMDYLTTFLPRTVVESLFTVMRQAGLVVAGITLEPIAALNALVSKENRRLNLALADIGAGTADIAITGNGNIISYGMTPYAGDKITERICDRYLTDFNTGEAIKRLLFENTEYIHFNDIFNNKIAVSYADVYDTVLPVVLTMAEKIAGVILSENAKPPAAVIVVGGGCRLPDLEICLAEALGMDRDRVTTRDRNSIIGLECNLEILRGPDSVTPFGIAISGAGDGAGRAELAAVSLNGRPVRLSNLQNHTVSEVLAAAAYNLPATVGRPGKSLSFYFNGEKKIVYGIPGHSAAIYLNGLAATPETPVKIGDKITVTDAAEGSDARVYISDLAPEAVAGSVKYAGVNYYITPRASLNGEECPISAEVREGDAVELAMNTTLGMLVNEYALFDIGTEYFVNGNPAVLDCVLQPGDEITIRREANVIEVNGEKISITETEGARDLILMDALGYVDVDGADRQGWLSLSVNGEPAKLTDRIRPGDRLVIKWVCD